MITTDREQYCAAILNATAFIAGQLMNSVVNTRSNEKKGRERNEKNAADRKNFSIFLPTCIFTL